MKDYASHDATGLAELVRTGEVTPIELVEDAIAAVEAVNPRINAVVRPLFDQARAAAGGELPDGPFRGVPFVVKDLDGFLAGEPYTMGCRFLKDFVPGHDAEVLARLKRSGLVIVGKTNCPELGLLGITEPVLHGATRNPWNPDHTPGGSSGGSAACVAARIVPMGHGGDGGGSIRLPASACGLVGMKATRGRIPLGPDQGEGWGGYVQPGVLTRTVRDLAAAMDVMAGPDHGGPYRAPPAERPYVEELGSPTGTLRVAWTSRSLFGQTTHRDCVAAVEAAAELCRELGHEVVEASPPIAKDELVWAYLVQVAASVGAEMRDFERWTGRTPTPDGFEPSTWFLAQVGEALSAADLQQSRDTCHAAGRVVERFLEDHDVFLCPTLAYPPVRVGELAPKPWELAGLSVIRRAPVKPVLVKVFRDMAGEMLEKTPNTQLFNQTGHPSMNVPLHWNAAGLPIGVQFTGRFGDEGMLVRLAARLEEARPWIERLPRVHA